LACDNIGALAWNVFKHFKEKSDDLRNECENCNESSNVTDFVSDCCELLLEQSLFGWFLGLFSDDSCDSSGSYSED